MDKKLNVVPFQVKQNLDAVELLEDMLEQVKSGSITAVAVSYVRPNGTIGGDISEGENNFYTLASIQNTLRTFERQTFDGD